MGMVTAALGLSLCGCGGRRGMDAEDGRGSARVPSITIIAREGITAHRLREIGKDFRDAYGIEVHVRESRASSFSSVLEELSGRGRPSFDMVLGEAQWLAEAIESNLYLDLSDDLKRGGELQVLNRRCRHLLGDPTGAGRYFSVPCAPDFLGLMVRRDWFEDETAKREFETLYARPLVPPRTWEELEQVASYFNRSDDFGFGILLPSDRDTDDMVRLFEALTTSFGGGKYLGRDTMVSGDLNGTNEIAQLNLLKSLVSLGPLNGANVTIEENVMRFVAGQAALSINWMSVFDGVLLELTSNKVSFLSLPGGPNGTGGVPMAGFGLSVIAKRPRAQQERAVLFLRWFLSSPTQTRWVMELGGAPISGDLTPRPERPYWNVYEDGVTRAQSLWAVPNQRELYPVLRRGISDALNGYVTPQAALGSVAAEWQLLSKKREILNRM